MSEEHIVNYSRSELPEDTGTDWERLEAMSEEEINEAAASDPDARPTNADFWKDAKVVMPKRKQPITLRVDQDVLAFFKEGGAGYQTRMNAVLRAFMEHQRKGKSLS